jgi:hypothetical protein
MKMGKGKYYYKKEFRPHVILGWISRLGKAMRAGAVFCYMHPT